MAGITIKVTGADGFDEFFDAADRTARLEDAMDAIIQDASSLLSEASPVGVYGHMQGAWLQTRGSEWQGRTLVGYSDPTPVAPYAWYVIYGRKPGKMPPPIELLPWVWKKLGVTGMKARGVAWNVARKIGRHGTKPNDFITPIVEREEPFWNRVLQGAFLGN